MEWRFKNAFYRTLSRLRKLPGVDNYELAAGIKGGFAIRPQRVEYLTLWMDLE
jgi:hypothetical protein